ncbi:hypothetical protein T440DRAFT_515655 [Plenodomus tracheiphilus IPT5]|uniref:Uncharacterized protein n=1 Tax=Plenodomus tracheiphilus IPT5 TaxID=1408161 RepID=A0A6A7BHE2_9PLEO|nr:hypothetical protein T440DRAFT_515655 [Plenodomus tracheiphilus IPT5]
MASPPKGPDQDRPAASTRSRSGLENMLPTSIGKGNRSKSRTRPGPTPHMDRSISSAMTDSFMLDHRGSYRSSINDHNTASTLDLQKIEDDDGLTPISNWAHLNFLKNQRNTLRNELKVQNLAGAEAKRSVSSLRRLAFRMAVNISVKEKKIATSAKNLSQSRKGSYLEGKDAEKRIEGLRRALRIEEKRNVEVLEALEHSTPKPKSQHRPQRSLLSPPPSPPTRLSDYSESSLGSPRTPIRPSTFDWSLTPGLESPTEVRTSDSRLIQAKRDCDRALAACRSRITELQEECAQGKEANELVLASRDDLEHEIKSHQSRIATLERSRAAVEATLSATRQQLALMRQTEDTLKHDLESKAQQICHLESRDKDRQRTIDTLREEKDSLEKLLQDRTLVCQELGNKISSLEEGTRLLQNKLESAERYEASLQDRLVEKERSREDLRKRVERGTQYIQLLESKIQGFEKDAMEHTRLQSQLKETEEATNNTKTALATLESEVVILREDLEKETVAHKQLSTEVDVNRTTISQLKDELTIMRTTLKQEKDAQSKLWTELNSLHSSYELANTNLQAAEKRIQFLEDVNHDTHNKLEVLRDNKMALEADLKEARQSLFRLREEQRMSEAELNRMEASKSELQEELQESKQQLMSLQQKLEEMHVARVALQEDHATDLLKKETQLADFKTSLRSLQTMLAATDQEKLGLQEELQQAQSVKESTERQLTEILNSKTSLKNKFDSVQEQLDSTETERKALLRRITQLENDLTVSFTAKSALEDRLGNTLNRHTELELLVAELESSLKSSRDASDKLEAAYTVAQKHDETSRAHIAELHGQVEETKMARGEAEVKYHDYMKSNKRLEQQLHAAQSKLADVESEAHSIRAELSVVQTEIGQYKQSNSSLTASLEVVQMQYNGQQEELVFTKSCLVAAEHNVKTLQWELSTAEEELAAMYREKLRTKRHLEEASAANKDLDNALRIARQDRTTVEERLTIALSLSLQATSELASTRSQLLQSDSDKVRLNHKLTEKEQELETLFQRSAEIQDELNQASAWASTLQHDLSVTSLCLLERDSENSANAAKLSANDELLTDLQLRENDYKEKLAQVESHSASLEKQAEQAHMRII